MLTGVDVTPRKHRARCAFPKDIAKNKVGTGREVGVIKNILDTHKFVNENCRISVNVIGDAHRA